MYKVGDGVAHHRLLSYVLKGRNMTTNTTKSTTGYKLWDKIDELKKLSGTKEKLSEDAVRHLSHELTYSDFTEFDKKDEFGYKMLSTIHVRKNDFLDGWFDRYLDFRGDSIYSPRTSINFVVHYDINGKDFIIDVGKLYDFLTDGWRSKPNDLELLGDDEINEKNEPTVQLSDKQRNMREYIYNVTKYQLVLKLSRNWYDYKRRVYSEIDDTNKVIPTMDELMNFNMTSYATFMDKEAQLKNAN